ncbi:MAG: hypothetical protein HY314_07865 [Acidobacteria bacterium]|nr:hypothetical protein [Acidobacteriota bacterium]
MMKRTLAFLTFAFVVILAAYSVFLIRRSLEREGRLGVGEAFPAVELQLIGAGDDLVHLPSGKKTLVVFFRYD